MEKIVIRDAKKSDKSSVLKFCKDTFSWGDYIQYVWDFWYVEGNLLVIEKKNSIGLCHALTLKNEIWIEGIRINSNFRRQGFASKLIKHVESIAKEKQISSSLMIIDVENAPSLSMVQNLGYSISEIWNFYLLSPKITNTTKIKFGNFSDHLEMYRYVNSWRWLTLDQETINSLSSKKKIIYSDKLGDISIAILTSSEHFDKTLIVTIFARSPTNTLELISYVQNYAFKKNLKKIQILTRENLPLQNDLELKIKFYLMQKSLD